MRNAVVSGGAADFSYSTNFSIKPFTALHFIRTFVQCFKEKEMGGDIYLNTKKLGGILSNYFCYTKLFPFILLHPSIQMTPLDEMCVCV